jgi:hypothetical protein
MERKDHENSTDEIEITSEMIEAGEDVLLSVLGGAVSSHWWPDELAKRVYLAMASRSPEILSGASQ